MTFYQFALKNVLRNKRLYAAYFLSSMFTVLVFFTFANFAFHPVFSSGEINSKAIFGMAVAGGIIYIFSFFFIFYSVSQFLKSRNKEFGLLMTQGMSMKQIRSMVFLENIVIGLFATLFGISLGLIFSKLILLIAENVLIIEDALNFYFPTIAILLTLVSFIGLFIIISFFVMFVLRSRKLIDLIKSDRTSKGEPKASLGLTILAAILLVGGYGIALYVKGPQVIVAMIPVILIVTLGTYLLFTQLSVYVIRKLKSSKAIFWRKTNILLLSDLSFRMKDNARTFFIVTMISTVAFSAIGTLFGVQSMLTEGMKEVHSYTFSYAPFVDEDEKVIENEIASFEQLLKEEGVTTSKEMITKEYFALNEESQSVLIVKESDYNRFAALINKDNVTLNDNETIVVQSRPELFADDLSEELLIDKPFSLTTGEKLKPIDTIYSNVFTEMSAYYIVSDEVYDLLPEPIKKHDFYAWEGAKGQTDKILKVGKRAAETGNYGITAPDYLLYEVNKVYGPMLFIGLFIGIVFFVSAGSFLYFRLYTDLEDDKQKFSAISKLGLTNKELNKVVSRQTALLFFAPIIVALVHGIVALTALAHLFEHNLVNVSITVLSSFIAIQIVYYFIMRYFYLKQIKSTL